MAHGKGALVSLPTGVALKVRGDYLETGCHGIPLSQWERGDDVGVGVGMGVGVVGCR